MAGVHFTNSTASPAADVVRRLVIVDGHAYAFRAFYAISKLSSPDGRPTNAVFGFIKAIERILANLKPSHLLVAWDGGLAAERVAALPAYKAQRPPTPPDLVAQFSEIEAFLTAARIAFDRQDGVEADDWIATMARQAVAKDLPVIVASSDKDFMQLVSPMVGLWNPGDSEPQVRGLEQVVQKTGVQPDQVVDWLSLIGDAVDNIPGVRGVGPKNATKLLLHYRTCDGLLGQLAQLQPESLRARIRAAEPDIRRNQRLIKLNDQLPGVLDLDRVRIKHGDVDRLRELYGRWGFKSLLAALPPAGPRQAELF